MQKKQITAFLLALAMSVTMALPTLAQGTEPQTDAAAVYAAVETATPETAPTAEPAEEPAAAPEAEEAETYDTEVVSKEQAAGRTTPPENGWYQEYTGGPWYWYENGVRQGTTGRGKEIYDPTSGYWYWLDAVNNGAMAYSKDVYQESSGGKWVRYDANGHMVKGWDTNSSGTYYFDLITGAMQKGLVTIDGKPCAFDSNTGIGLDKKWVSISGKNYWYENGVRQGYDPNNTSYRGKEIYDPASDAWYWLDNVQQGAMAVSKDVYQESAAGQWAENKATGTGKWVRYDANGHMVKGWSTNSNGTYYFDTVYGTMAKGTVTIDGKSYTFDSTTGILKTGTKYKEIKRTNYQNGSVFNTMTTTYDSVGRIKQTQRRGSNNELQVQDDYTYGNKGMLTDHSHREYQDESYSYRYTYEYDSSDRYSKITYYVRSGSSWVQKGYWQAKSWDSNGSVTTFWEYNSAGKVTCIINLTSSTRNNPTKMTVVNSSNVTVRTDTWTYDSTGAVTKWQNSGNSNSVSAILAVGNPLFDRNCQKYITKDGVKSAWLSFQYDEVVETGTNGSRENYTTFQDSDPTGDNKRTCTTYKSNGSYWYNTVIEYTLI